MPPRLAPPPPSVQPIGSTSTSVSSQQQPLAQIAGSRSDPKPVLKATKEWIVPPRPKPGRKSIKPPAEPKTTTAKTTQKAFRERRQEYVTELEEKVRQLEAGEGEKCVFYQQQAQRAVAETRGIQRENERLKGEVERLSKEVEMLKKCGKEVSKGTTRNRPEEFDEETLSTTTITSKRPRRSAAVRAQAVVAAHSGGGGGSSTSPHASGSVSSPRSQHRLSVSSYASSHSSPSTSTSSNSPPTFPSSSFATSQQQQSQTAPVFAHSPLNDTLPASPAPLPHPTLQSQPQPPPYQLPIPRHLQSSHSHSPSCGFCASSTDCLCAEIGYKSRLNASSVPSNPTASHEIASSANSQLANNNEDDDDFLSHETIYEPAVPLRIISSNRSSTSTIKRRIRSVWEIDPPKNKFETVVKVAEKVLCSGDPENCPACGDDPFGKAFCNALSSTVCSTTPCANCPGNCSNNDNNLNTSSASTIRRIPTPPPEIASSYIPPPPPPPASSSTHKSTLNDAEEAALFESLTDLPCCGDPQLCGSLTCQPSSSTESTIITPTNSTTTTRVQGGGPVDAMTVLLPRSVEPGVRTIETVPCNEAWSVLKAHPNIAFADLQMLAEVVSKRTHCAGPVPSPSTSTFPRPPPSRSPQPPSSSASTIPSDPHTTLQCSMDAGTRKRLTVERDAVNEALELLDRTAAKGGSMRK